MRGIRLLLGVLSALAATALCTEGQEIALHFSPQQSTVNFTLDDVIHTVHGSFTLKSGDIHFIPATNKVSGEIVVDAASGNSANERRDKKMHREILESIVYPDIVFRPNRVEGTVAPQGDSGVQVYGTFSIHGSNHAVVLPVRVELAPDHWKLTARFGVPYVKWGLKDPSTLILRVEKTVNIELQAAGTNPWSPTP